MSAFRVVAGLVVVLLVGTVCGLAVLWPERGEIPRSEELGPPPRTEKAEIMGVRSAPCGEGTGRQDCLRVSADLKSGPDEGDEVAFTFATVEGDFGVGDDIRVHKNELPPDAVEAGVEVDPYSFSDFERRQPMLGLLVMFAALVLLTGRPCNANRARRARPRRTRSLISPLGDPPWSLGEPARRLTGGGRLSRPPLVTSNGRTA